MPLQPNYIGKIALAAYWLCSSGTLQVFVLICSRSLTNTNSSENNLTLGHISSSYLLQTLYMACATQYQSKTPIIPPPIILTAVLLATDALVTVLSHATHCHSKTPELPVTEAPEMLTIANEDCVGEQIGGRCHCPSPLPLETPIKLRPCIKPTEHATGVIQQAGCHRA